MQKAIQLINNQISKFVHRKVCDQKTIDEGLQQVLNNNGGLGSNSTLSVSYSLPFITAKVFHQELFEVLRQTSGYKASERALEDAPKIMINLLQGSKLIGSKCKVNQALLNFRFF